MAYNCVEQMTWEKADEILLKETVDVFDPEIAAYLKIEKGKFLDSKASLELSEGEAKLLADI